MIKLYRDFKDLEEVIVLDHVCRHCSGGRIVQLKKSGMTPGGNPIKKCIDCGRSTWSSVDDLCWCGQHFKNQRQHDSAYQCIHSSFLKMYPELARKCGSTPDKHDVCVVLREDINEIIRQYEGNE